MDMIVIVLLIGIAIVVAVALTVVSAKPPSEHARRPGDDPYSTALNALLSGQKELAFQKLKEAVRHDSDNADAYLKLGDLFRERGHVNKALRIHNDLTFRPALPKEIEQKIYESLAKDYLEAGDRRRAVEMLRTVLGRDKRNVWAWSTLISILEQQGQWAEAYQARLDLLKLEKRQNGRVLALYKVFEGQELFAQRRFHDARIKFKEAMKEDRTCPPAYLYLGDSYYEEQRLGDAVEAWRRMISEVPEMAYLTFGRLERTYYEMGDFGSVAMIYRDLVDRYPTDIRALDALSSILEKMGQIDEAIGICERAASVAPRAAPPRLRLARLFQQKGDITTAAEQIEQLVSLSSESHHRYICQSCGYESADPLWRCPECGRVNA